jgi:2-polyprenyl-3-methyl-5-hydroxy-6-metoxy-1,4-benzoquinol methylase
MIACRICGAAHTTRWCEASDAEYHTTAESFTYWRCTECGSLSIDPCPSDRLAEIYPSTYYSFAPARASAVERVKLWLDRCMLRDVLRNVPGTALAALDVGGGTGWMLDQARRCEPRLRRTVVVEMDAQARAAALAAGHEFVACRIEEFTTAERFDLILMLNLVEHVADPVSVLAAAGCWLTPHGRILVKTPNPDSLDARLFRSSYWGGLHCPRHWALLTPAGMRLAARRAGLTVGRMQLTQGGAFWTWSVLAALARRGVVRVERERPMWRHPLAPPLLAAFAALDLLRRPFMSTSQMFVELSRTDGARR